MEKDNLLTNLVDLHLHLGSASPPHILWEIAHEQGIKLREKDYWKFIDSVTIKENTDYDTYLEFFHVTELIQSSTHAIEKACHQAVSYYYRTSDVRTIELRFNPMLRNKGGEQDLDKIVFSSLVGTKRACLEYPVKAGIILMMDRRFDKEKNTIIAKKAVRFKNEGVVGIDIAGPLNENFKIDDIVEAVQIAQDAGLKVTIHTGEVTPPEEMWEVVEKLKPNRIGHGVRCVEDKKLMQKIAKEKIILEICPTSNIRTQAIKDWTHMKKTIRTLIDNKVLFTINTDGPELIETTVKKELEKMLEHDILSLQELKEVIDLSHNVTFIK
ncbi:MAG TPA: adenosine deaminase [Candidatus Woesebacteria bacterium]|nr:adenosine deaminase [Candidatus Woesebacteria bacterium]